MPYIIVNNHKPKKQKNWRHFCENGGLLRTILQSYMDTPKRYITRTISQVLRKDYRLSRMDDWKEAVRIVATERGVGLELEPSHLENKMIIKITLTCWMD